MIINTIKWKENGVKLIMLGIYDKINIFPQSAKNILYCSPAGVHRYIDGREDTVRPNISPVIYPLV